MDSDDDEMEAPPPEYFRLRRRSNTLPSHILRHLKDKHKVKEANSGPSELTTKLRHYLSAEKQRKLPPLDQSDGSNTNSPRSANNRTKNGKITSNLLNNDGQRKSEYGSHQHVAGNANKYIDTLIRASSTEALPVRRSPLPRGSNIYESLMAEFGHDEEERDTLTPLGSPELRRKTKHRHNVQHVTASRDDTDDDVMKDRRRVHWSHDIKFNKFSKKK